MQSSDEQSPRQVAETQFTKMRWALGLMGFASVVVAIMLLAWPGISVYALTIVFGIYALATGIVSFGSAFASENKDERGWLILSGLLGIGAGIVVLVWPGISALALLYVIGVYAVLLGLTVIAGSFQLPTDGRDTALMILSGLVSIAFGVVIFAKPGAGALAVLALIAAFFLITGLSELVLAIGGKKLVERQITKAFKAESPASPTRKHTPQPSH
jgi:uncharacterized membrane protein HdeD (DUF308 family)